MTAIALSVLALVAGPPHTTVKRTPAELCTRISCKRRVGRKQRRRRMWRVVKPYNDKLNRIAYCESTGRWFLYIGNGYSGGLQFVVSTWHSLGGKGLPHEHSELEQKYFAVKLYHRNGDTWVTTAGWPVCGYR